jgi:Flp pilus assembly pilin Flp
MRRLWQDEQGGAAAEYALLWCACAVAMTTLLLGSEWVVQDLLWPAVEQAMRDTTAPVLRP